MKLFKKDGASESFQISSYDFGSITSYAIYILASVILANMTGIVDFVSEQISHLVDSPDAQASAQNALNNFVVPMLALALRKFVKNYKQEHKK